MITKTKLKYGDDLWPLIGPILCSKDGPLDVNLTDDTIWYVFIEDSQVMSMCAVTKKKSYNNIGSLFTLKEFRREGIGSMLIECALEDYSEPFKCVASPDSKEMFSRLGFEKYGVRGKYDLMVKQ
jgi:GNAT superfamily N-acetyltransferase